MLTQTLQIIKYQEVLCIIAKLFCTQYGSIPTAFDYGPIGKGRIIFLGLYWAQPILYWIYLLQHLNTNKIHKSLIEHAITETLEV